MKRRMRFLANETIVDAEAWELDPALDFIRLRLGLTGTKEGCREGDCGACAVIVGERSEMPGESFSYRAMPSCLLVLGELEGRHLITIEGLARSACASGGGLSSAPEDMRSPVMRAIAEANGSQCGFCSPGFVVSLSAYLLGGAPLSPTGAFASIEGNLCRCTGYGAIKRAAEVLVEEFLGLPNDPLARLDALVAAGVFPPSSSAFARGGFHELSPAAATTVAHRGGFALGGGSDYLVRNPEPDESAIGAFRLLDREPELKRIEFEGEFLAFGAALNWREFFSSPELLSLYPGIGAFVKLLASPLVRERATLGGNIANASPVGDLSSILIALGARLRIESPAGRRELPIEKLFIGYKKLDLASDEIISAVLVPASKKAALFNFEKASKREKLDIAAVNTAAVFALEEGGDRIARARLSAGGVAPVPLFLEKTSSFLVGREISAETALEAARIAASEASPIGDIRGSADYRGRVLERMLLGHFIRLFPDAGIEEAVL